MISTINEADNMCWHKYLISRRVPCFENSVLWNNIATTSFSLSSSISVFYTLHGFFDTLFISNFYIFYNSDSSLLAVLKILDAEQILSASELSLSSLHLLDDFRCTIARYIASSPHEPGPGQPVLDVLVPGPSACPGLPHDGDQAAHCICRWDHHPLLPAHRGGQGAR